jgi:tetratricopeptide (TPR) repeat protein
VATLQIGLGILEARHALQSGQAIACVEALKSASTQARPRVDDEDPTDVVEFQLASAELDRALQLARGHRVRIDASARGNSLMSMQLQFEVWHTIIDCDVSMRTLDVASLRRTVETFTHYVAEQPGLVAWLEVARAHLALCLGKPHEALATYNKWLDELRPGKHLAWDTLFFGRAEALLSSGDAVAARNWLEEALTHPVVRGATDSAVCVTLEAQLARAEAESHAVAAATARIQALVQRLKDSDHALALGFVHEVAARVAHRANDETRCAEHLTEMRNWYTLTRNQAAMMRGQKVHDSLVETRSSRVPPEPEVDRNIVTKVTTRRESSCE